MEIKKIKQGSRLTNWLLPGVGGFIFGGILSIVIAWTIFLFKPAPVSSIPTLTTIEPTSTPTISISAIATTEALHIIVEQGCNYFDENQWQQAVDTLSAHVLEITNTEDQIRCYKCLALAENYLFNFQMEAFYYDQLYLLEPKSEYVFYAAMAYDNGGDLLHALEKYLLFLELNDPETVDYQSLALERSLALQEILRQTTPTP